MKMLINIIAWQAWQATSDHLEATRIELGLLTQQASALPMGTQICCIRNHYKAKVSYRVQFGPF